MNGKLYLVSTPIGNSEDITLRALKVLRSVDFIICEEFKQARRFLSKHQIEKELFSLNEHNEKESVEEIFPLLQSGKQAALISDCGTPLFSDPGHILVEECIAYKIDIVPVPGVNSLMPALIMSGLDIEKFYYYGWLSPKKDERRKELLNLKRRKDLLVLMDTPYRLIRLLEDIQKHFGNDQHIVLAYKITMEDEKYFRGNVAKILRICNEKKLKGEFVVLLDNR